MNRKMIIIHVKGGLANRLRALLSAKILAENMDRDFQVVWPVDDRCFCVWQDLFETQIPLIEDGTYPGSVLRINQADAREKIAKLSRETSYDIIYIASFSQFRLEKAMTWQEYITRFRELFNQLAPIKIIRDSILVMPENTIGIHVRRGDHTTSREVSTDAKFTDQMDLCIEKYKNVRFFLSTDDKNVKTSFVNKYGSRILTYDINYDRTAVTGTQHALLDFLTLLRTKMILGSYKSSFSKLASQISAIPFIPVGHSSIEQQAEQIAKCKL